jgi:hypothetical protein
METLRFTIASDVWSYGITMLEIYGNGARPYAAVTETAAVMTMVMAGNRAPIPEGYVTFVVCDRSGVAIGSCRVGSDMDKVRRIWRRG